jgi:hypothetical protein
MSVGEALIANATGAGRNGFGMLERSAPRSAPVALRGG